MMIDPKNNLMKKDAAVFKLFREHYEKMLPSLVKVAQRIVKMQ